LLSRVKVGLLERLKPSMRRGWEATVLLREGKLAIKNFAAAFCEKRPHFFLPELNNSAFFQSIHDLNR
jgi:hypothetical protein